MTMASTSGKVGNRKAVRLTDFGFPAVKGASLFNPRFNLADRMSSLILTADFVEVFNELIEKNVPNIELAERVLQNSYNDMELFLHLGRTAKISLVHFFKALEIPNLKKHCRGAEEVVGFVCDNRGVLRVVSAKLMRQSSWRVTASLLANSSIRNRHSIVLAAYSDEYFDH